MSQDKCECGGDNGPCDYCLEACVKDVDKQPEGREPRKLTPVSIEVAPHVRGEIPDTGTYAGELYMLATKERLVALNTHAQMVAENQRLREALTPSTETKAAYMGEFKFQVSEGAGMRDILVPWTTIKEIMVAIRNYADGAALQTSGAGDE